MFDNITEQFQNSFKPVNELAAVNAKAMEQFTQQQANLFTEMMNAGTAYVEGISAQKDVAGIVEAQKSYAEDVQEKVVAAAKETYAVVTETQEQASDILKGAFEQTKEAAATATKAAAKAPAAKAAK